MDRSEAITLLRVSLKTVVELLTDEEVETCVDIGAKECGWAFPMNRPFREYWVVERAKRAAISMLALNSAQKFKFKQIHLNQRWEHYQQMLKHMDDLFAKAKKENPDEFSDVSLDDIPEEERRNMFGMYLYNNLAKSPVGRFEE
jgi:hypothetical protein